MDAVMTQMRSGWERIHVQFENKITTGTILQLLGMAGCLIVFMLAYEHRMTVLETRQAQIIERQGDQDRMLGEIQRQLQGRVIPAGRANELSTVSPPQ